MKKRYVVSNLTRLITAALLFLLATLSAAYVIYEYELFAQNVEDQRAKLNNYLLILTEQMKSENEKLVSLSSELAQHGTLENTDMLLRFNGKQGLYQQMGNFLSSNTRLDYLMIQKEEALLLSSAEYCPVQERNEIYQYAKQKELPITSDRKNVRWALVSIGQNEYLLGAYRINGYTVASYRAVDRAFDFSSLYDTAILGLAVTDAQGKVLLAEIREGALPGQATRTKSIPWNEENSVLLEENIANTPLKLQMFLPKCLLGEDRKEIPFSAVILGVTVLVAIFLLLSIRYMVRKDIGEPTKELVRAIEEIQKGNMEYRIASSPTSAEFELLVNQFNEMASEIRTLKIEQYERQLQMRKNQLVQLQSQIKTHFYLNAFTTIQSMTYQNRNQDIRTYVQALSRYMRYMLRLNKAYVTLEEEIRHIGDYFEMQKLKFPGSVELNVEGLEQTAGCVVPYLSIYTVAENTIKHAMTLQTLLRVSIVCTIQEDGALRVRVEDNGKGFAPELLEPLNQGKLLGKDGHCVGLNNVWATLRLLYERDDLFRAGNQKPSGAWVEMVIPQRGQEQKEGERTEECGI